MKINEQAKIWAEEERKEQLKNKKKPNETTKPKKQRIVPFICPIVPKHVSNIAGNNLK